MTPSSLQLRASRPRLHHDRWIIAIGVFKLLQALLFILLGIGAMRLLHKDLMDLAERFILSMRFDPEGHFVNLFLDKVALIDPHRLKQITAVVFAIAALDMIEGTGLVLEKAWAEYVTLVLTASFLPWEFFEILRHITWIRAVLLIINLAVVIYLLYFVKQRVRQRQEKQPAALG
ncbi:MAG TPA: DUF2127 domain-containing protein [Acidobacteriaceae bacterium]|jgi:uncharacterized membrane protein (DUF2068 family)|nr:DUF2127 domain-containing protein [Acidobacteriaceae bacterium]